MFFTMSIDTTTGYSTMVVYNNIERLIFIIFIYYGDVLVSIGLGMMTQNYQFLTEKEQKKLEKMKFYNNNVTDLDFNKKIKEYY